MSRIHVYFLVVGYANASPLTDITFVLTDDILVKAQDHDIFHHLFLSGNWRLHGWVWLLKINPIRTVKDYHYFCSINKEIATRNKFYKCNDFYLRIGSIHHSKVLSNPVPDAETVVMHPQRKWSGTDYPKNYEVPSKDQFIKHVRHF